MLESVIGVVGLITALLAAVHARRSAVAARASAEAAECSASAALFRGYAWTNRSTTPAYVWDSRRSSAAPTASSGDEALALSAGALHLMI